MIAEGEVLAFERCIGSGGVAIFPTDTVYGIGCDPDNADAVRRVYLIKNRPVEKKVAWLFFSVDRAVSTIKDLGPNTIRALHSLLPGPVTVLLADGDERRGIRVPKMSGDAAALARVDCAVLATSANLSGGEDPRRLRDVPPELREAVNLQLDGGELPGIASTVVDLGEYERSGRYEIVREGALEPDAVASLLG